jgi:cytosine deaminase
MLQIAWLMGHAAHLSTPPEIDYLFEMITSNGAKALDLKNYGLSVGKLADLNILKTKSAADAIRLQPEMAYVIKSGKVIQALGISKVDE